MHVGKSANTGTFTFFVYTSHNHIVLMHKGSLVLSKQENAETEDLTKTQI